jgi:hypothetical protein
MQIPVVYLFPLAWASSPGKYRGNLAATHVRLGQFQVPCSLLACATSTSNQRPSTSGRAGSVIRLLSNFWSRIRISTKSVYRP